MSKAVNRTDEFLRSIREAMAAPLPPEVIQRTRQALMDYIGVTLAGRAFHAGRVDALMDGLAGSGTVCPVGINKPIDLTNAVFLNGLNAHVLDFDDGTNAGIIHLGSPVFSVLLALAQTRDITEEELIRAAVTGYETEFTMARSVQPAAKKRGYHATGVCGVLGAAAAAACALGYDQAVNKEAFSAAAVSATGTLKVLEDSSELKPYNAAKAAMLGMIAAMMAGAGFRGPEDVLSGTAGYLMQTAGTEELELVSPLLGGTYAVQKAYIKPYAACRYCHPAVDIALDIYNNEEIDPAGIRDVHIRTYGLAVRKHDHTDIPGASSARMSIPYNFAATCITGRTGMDAFEPDVLESREVRELTAKVRVSEDEVMTEAFPELTPAEAEVVMSDGRTYRGSRTLPKGEPEDPLSQEEAEAKFTSLALYGGKSRAEAEEIIRAVMGGAAPSELTAMLR